MLSYCSFIHFPISPRAQGRSWGGRWKRSLLEVKAGYVVWPGLWAVFWDFIKGPVLSFYLLVRVCLFSREDIHKLQTILTIQPGTLEGYFIASYWDPEILLWVIGGFYLKSFNYDVYLAQPLVFSRLEASWRKSQDFVDSPFLAVWFLVAETKVRTLQSHTINVIHFLVTTSEVLQMFGLLLMNCFAGIIIY